MTAETVPTGSPGQSGGEGAGPAPEKDISPEILEEIHAAALAGLPTDKPTDVVPFVDVTPRLGKRAERQAKKAREQEIVRQTGSFQIVSRTEQAIDNPEKTDILIEQAVFLGKNKDGVETWGQLLVLADTSQGPQTQITYDDPERVAWALKMTAKNLQIDIDKPNSPYATTRRLRSGNYDEDRAAITQTIQEWTTLAAEMVPANLKFNLLRNRLRQNDTAHAVVLMVGQEVYVAQCGTTMVQVVDRAGVTRNISFDTPDAPIHLDPTDTLVVASDGFVSRAGIDIESAGEPPTTPSSNETPGGDANVTELVSFIRTKKRTATHRPLRKEVSEKDHQMRLKPNQLRPLFNSIRLYEPGHTIESLFIHNRTVEQDILAAQARGQDAVIDNQGGLLPFIRQGDQTLVLIRPQQTTEKRPPNAGSTSVVYMEAKSPSNRDGIRHQQAEIVFPNAKRPDVRVVILASHNQNPALAAEVAHTVSDSLNQYRQGWKKQLHLRRDRLADAKGVSLLVADLLPALNQQWLQQKPQDARTASLTVLVIDNKAVYYCMGPAHSLYRLPQSVYDVGQAQPLPFGAVDYQPRFDSLAIHPEELLVFSGLNGLDLAVRSFGKLKDGSLPSNSDLIAQITTSLSDAGKIAESSPDAYRRLITNLISSIINQARESQQTLSHLIMEAKSPSSLGENPPHGKEVVSGTKAPDFSKLSFDAQRGGKPQKVRFQPLAEDDLCLLAVLACPSGSWQQK